LRCRLIGSSQFVREQGKPDSTTFADGWPALVLSNESLDDINARLTEVISVRNFRVRVVIVPRLAWQPLLPNHHHPLGWVLCVRLFVRGAGWVHNK
jgi:hypothetical protein